MSPLHRDYDLTGLNVLIVEDDYLLASELSERLGAQGASIIGPIADLASAFDALNGDQPDVAVLDINVRGSPIYDLADELLSRGVRVIFTSGYEELYRPKKLSLSAFFLKPIDLQAVSRTLADLSSERTP
jgi:two-component SAPR family response regulator